MQNTIFNVTENDGKNTLYIYSGVGQNNWDSC